jgi:hypothetical protein
VVVLKVHSASFSLPGARLGLRLLRQRVQEGEHRPRGGGGRLLESRVEQGRMRGSGAVGLQLHNVV